ncbi:hypothetical protein N7D90_14300 [Pseudomonas fragi]|uniref:hypothetical protein n=1 Tax=Pseudomonas TaxID=286 RepID=UPI0021C0F8B1|nr:MULTISPECIES: hypothetical protein [Pseudomonas]UXL36782.1 hypothetical protein N7D90_14300 [Pseudomonas fragi]
MRASLFWIYEWGNNPTFNPYRAYAPIVYGDPVITDIDHPRVEGDFANAVLMWLAFMHAGPLLC